MNIGRGRLDILAFGLKCYSGTVPSRELAAVLHLDGHDLHVLEQGDGRRPDSIFPTLAESAEAYGFLNVLVDGEEFALFCKHVCGRPYGADWVNLVMAVCTSNEGMSVSTGGGTTRISVLPDEWHQKLVRYLGDDKSPEAPSWLPDELKGRW